MQDACAHYRVSTYSLFVPCIKRLFLIYYLFPLPLHTLCPFFICFLFISLLRPFVSVPFFMCSISLFCVLSINIPPSPFCCLFFCSSFCFPVRLLLDYSPSYFIHTVDQPFPSLPALSITPHSTLYSSSSLCPLPLVPCFHFALELSYLYHLSPNTLS
jgi:hypothetical protein